MAKIWTDSYIILLLMTSWLLLVRICQSYECKPKPITDEELKALEDKEKEYYDEASETDGDDFDDDIKNDKGSERLRPANATRYRIRRWPGGIVPYTISSSIPSYQIQGITKAMNDFVFLTCIKFIPRTDQDDYIELETFEHNQSPVGRQGGIQKVQLRTDAEEGTIIHELLHAIGFWHEHSRRDRDKYVLINTDNIIPKALVNFEKKQFSLINNLNMSYDIHSIMHYIGNEFAIDESQPTIIARDCGTMGQRDHLTDADVLKIRKFYECKEVNTNEVPEI